MEDVVHFTFGSDTNQNNAFEELQLMSLDVLYKDGNDLVVGREDFSAMWDSIEAVVEENGGWLNE